MYSRTSLTLERLAQRRSIEHRVIKIKRSSTVVKPLRCSICSASFDADQDTAASAQTGGTISDTATDTKTIERYGDRKSMEVDGVANERAVDPQLADDFDSNDGDDRDQESSSSSATIDNSSVKVATEEEEEGAKKFLEEKKEDETSSSSSSSSSRSDVSSEEAEESKQESMVIEGLKEIEEMEAKIEKLNEEADLLSKHAEETMIEAVAQAEIAAAKAQVFAQKAKKKVVEAEEHAKASRAHLSEHISSREMIVKIENDIDMRLTKEITEIFKQVPEQLQSQFDEDSKLDSPPSPTTTNEKKEKENTSFSTPSGLTTDAGRAPRLGEDAIDYNHDFDMLECAGSYFKGWTPALTFVYTLTHPGAPCIFATQIPEIFGVPDEAISPHEREFHKNLLTRDQIQELLAIRRRNDVKAAGTVKIVHSEKDLYAALINSRLFVKIGPRFDLPADVLTSCGKTLSDFELCSSGHQWAVWQLPGNASCNETKHNELSKLSDSASTGKEFIEASEKYSELKTGHIKNEEDDDEDAFTFDGSETLNPAIARTSIDRAKELVEDDYDESDIDGRKSKGRVEFN